jgi:hypothetical protein
MDRLVVAAARLGRVLKRVATDPTARKALQAQISYRASLANEMGYVLSAGRRP